MVKRMKTQKVIWHIINAQTFHLFSLFSCLLVYILMNLWLVLAGLLQTDYKSSKARTIPMGFQERSLWLAFGKFRPSVAKVTLVKPIALSMLQFLWAYEVISPLDCPALNCHGNTPIFYLLMDPTEQAVGIQLMLADCRVNVLNIIGLLAIDTR